MQINVPQPAPRVFNIHCYGMDGEEAEVRRAGSIFCEAHCTHTINDGKCSGVCMKPVDGNPGNPHAGQQHQCNYHSYHTWW